MLDEVLEFLTDDAPNAVDRLRNLLSIPSVSTDPKYKDDVHRAANLVADTLRAAGLTAEVEQGKGHPIVYATTPEDASLTTGPRVLFYGHYDVQPPDPIAKWSSDPFGAEVRDDVVYARGAADDKGPVSCFIEALRAWHAVHGKLPVPVTLVIEGEEECGSKSLPDFFEKHRDELAQHDFVLVSDTNMWDASTPAITYGLRGLLYYDIKLHNAARDLHSGMYGGVSANPAVMLTQVLGKLFDSNHRVTIPGFYDDVVDITAEERAAWAKTGFDEHEHCLKGIGVATPFGEAGYSTLDRKWARPACDINGLYGGYGGEGAKTVIPSFAGAKVSFRLAANQNPKKIAAAFEAWLKSHAVHGCRWELTHLGDADPVIVATDSPWIEAASKAAHRVFGKPAVLMREGATIPIIGELKTKLGLDSVLLGFDLPEDSIHAPDEHFGLDRFRKGAATHAALLGELAGRADA